VPILVTCECGKKFRARDEDAGKRSRCPGCQRGVTIPGGVKAAKTTPPPTARTPPAAPTKPAGPVFHVTRGHLVLIAVALVVTAVALFIEYGPARTHSEWERISEQARYDITDVVIRAIQSQHSQFGLGSIGGAGSLRTRPNPAVNGLAIIDTGVSWTIPKTVGFSGISTEGPFKGTYRTRTGEVECDLFFWGAKLKVTGRVKQGDIQAEINGKPALILPPPPQ
jgi:hypothetical protein